MMAENNNTLPSKRIKDLRGRRFGRLEVLAFVGLRGSAAHPAAWWCCRCDCGNVTEINSGELLRKPNGQRQGVRSCGCLQPESAVATHTKHGLCHSPEYQAWSDMRVRCYNPKAGEFKNYGARGIIVCPEWRENFDQFYMDIGPRPSPDHSLDRIDVYGNYEKSNVRWATKKEQQRNQRRTRWVIFNGERITLAEAAERMSINRHQASGRWRKGTLVREAAKLGVSLAVVENRAWDDGHAPG